MYRSFYKLIFIFTINLIISVPIYAKTVEQKTINFNVSADELIKGEIHYYFALLTPTEFAANFANAYELDSLMLTQEDDVKMLVNKVVTIIHKPVGFFDDKQMLDERFVKHMMGQQSVVKTGVDTYKITVAGESGFTYKMQSFFDADDISTLPNSKVIRAVSAAKKLDVISQSASTIMFVEKTNFTKHTKGGVSVSSFIPMKENKTLVITYNLWAIKKGYASPKTLKESFLNEITAVKALQDNYK